MRYINLHFTYLLTAYGKNICCPWDTAELSGHFGEPISAPAWWCRNVLGPKCPGPKCLDTVFLRLKGCGLLKNTHLHHQFRSISFPRRTWGRLFSSTKHAQKIKIYKKLYHLFTLLIYQCFQSPLSFCGIPIPKMLSQKFPSWHESAHCNKKEPDTHQKMR